MGIELSDHKPADDWMRESMEIQVPERDVLPFETTDPGYVPRTFCVPARVLNQLLGKPADGALRGNEISSDECDEEWPED